jgi:hypothetical protein
MTMRRSSFRIDVACSISGATGPIKEREAREQLVKQWSQFSAADRAYCQELHKVGGDTTYTELLTCLELQRDARNLREKERGTVGRPSMRR